MTGGAMPIRWMTNTDATHMLKFISDESFDVCH